MTSDFIRELVDIHEKKNQLVGSVTTQPSEYKTYFPNIVEEDKRILSLKYNCDIVDISKYYTALQKLVRQEVKILEGASGSEISEPQVKDITKRLLHRSLNYLRKLCAYIAGGNLSERKQKMISSIEHNELRLAEGFAVSITKTTDERALISRFFDALKRGRIKAARQVMSEDVFKEMFSEELEKLEKAISVLPADEDTAPDDIPPAPEEDELERLSGELDEHASESQGISSEMSEVHKRGEDLNKK